MTELKASKRKLTLTITCEYDGDDQVYQIMNVRDQHRANANDYHPASVNLNAFKAGWAVWCSGQREHACINSSELIGWRYADLASCGPSCPHSSESWKLDANDIERAVESDC